MGGKDGYGRPKCSDTGQGAALTRRVPKIYFTAHPDDLGGGLPKIAEDILDLADVAIWYDEYLTPGENFNDSIAAAFDMMFYQETVKTVAVSFATISIDSNFNIRLGISTSFHYVIGVIFLYLLI